MARRGRPAVKLTAMDWTRNRRPQGYNIPWSACSHWWTAFDPRFEAGDEYDGDDWPSQVLRLTGSVLDPGRRLR